MPGVLVFCWLPAQDTRRLIALKARVLVERSMDRIRDLGLVGRFLLVGFADHGRPQIDHFAGGLVHQCDVLVRMRFPLAAVMGLLLGGVGRALAAPLRAVHGPLGWARSCAGAVAD